MADEPILREGAVALITGASSGIGLATAEALNARGARVICAGRRLAKLHEITARLGSRASALELDVTDAAAVAGLMQRLPEALREIDIVIANAGHDAGGRRPFHEGRMDDWASIIATNVTGVIRVLNAVLPGMLERGRGHVVTLGSQLGLVTGPKVNVYAASKHALHALTDGLRADYAASDLRFTEILPGLVRTDFARVRLYGDEAKADAFYDSFPQALEARDVAESIVYALSQPAHVNVAQILITPTRTR